jgi:hypothetical protein
MPIIQSLQLDWSVWGRPTLTFLTTLSAPTRPLAVCDCGHLCPWGEEVSLKGWPVCAYQILPNTCLACQSLKCFACASACHSPFPIPNSPILQSQFSILIFSILHSLFSILYSPCSILQFSILYSLIHHSPFTIPHSPFSILNSQFSNSLFSILNSPFSILHSPILHSPLQFL